MHAGTALDAEGRLVSSGGRVLAVVGTGDDLEQARAAGVRGDRHDRVWPAPSTAPTSPPAAAGGCGGTAHDRQRAGQPVRLAGDAGHLVGGEQDHRRAAAVAGRAGRPERSRRRLRRRRPGHGARGVRRRCSTRSTWPASPSGSRSPGTTSRRGSRSSTPWPAIEHVHKGMTSRDLTENVEQLQIVSALRPGARAGWSPCWSGSASWPPATPTSRSPAGRTTSPPR